MAHPDLRRKRHNPRISRKGFMNQNPSHYPCHLCGELEHAHEMRVNIQNGAALCACCVLEHFEPGRDEAEAEHRMTNPSQNFDLRIRCDDRPLWFALLSLEQLAAQFPKNVRRFLGGLDPPSKLIRIDSDRSLAIGEGEFRLVLKPSDDLRTSLSAFGPPHLPRLFVDLQPLSHL